MLRKQSVKDTGLTVRYVKQEENKLYSYKSDKRLQSMFVL